MNSQRTLLVTGATSGIGYATSQTLLAQGHRIIGVGRNFSKIDCSHKHFIPCEIDFARLERLPDLLRQIEQQYPVIDGLICCAGFGRFGNIEEFSYPQIAQLINVNLTSQIMLVRALLPNMKKQPRGDIIMIGSEAGLSGGRRGAVYSASKAALRGFSQALRDECSRSRIRVSLLNPGMVATPFFNELSFRPGKDEDNFITAEDIAQTVAFILNSRPGTVFDEINLSPLKKVIQFE